MGEQKVLPYCVVQIDPNADVPLAGNETLTGDGVLVPRNADGFYRSLEDAVGVAMFLQEQNPQLETYVLEVVRFLPAARAGLVGQPRPILT